MKSQDEDSDTAPKLEEFASLDEAIQAKIKHYKQFAEELAEDR